MNNEHATCVTTYTSCTQRLSHKTSTTQFRYTLKKFFFVGVGGEQEKKSCKTYISVFYFQTWLFQNSNEILHSKVNSISFCI